MRVWDGHGEGPSALLAGFLQWKGSIFVGWDACHLLSPSWSLGLEEGVETTWRTLSTGRTTTGHCRVRVHSITYTVLASGHWRTTQAGNLFIAEIPSLFSGRTAIIFWAFPSLNDAYTETSGRWVSWRSNSSSEGVCCYFGFANVTNTFNACKRNAVHTSESKEQSLIWQSILKLFHCKQRKSSVKQGPSNYRASARVGRSGRTERQAEPFSRPGRADGRSRDEPGYKYERSTLRSPWSAYVKGQENCEAKNKMCMTRAVSSRVQCKKARRTEAFGSSYIPPGRRCSFGVSALLVPKQEMAASTAEKAVPAGLTTSRKAVPFINSASTPVLAIRSPLERTRLTWCDDLRIILLLQSKGGVFQLAGSLPGCTIARRVQPTPVPAEVYLCRDALLKRCFHSDMTIVSAYRPCSSLGESRRVHVLFKFLCKIFLFQLFHRLQSPKSLQLLARL